MTDETILTPITGWQQIIASGSGAILTALFMTPFDVIKVRLQSQTSNHVQYNFTKSSTSFSSTTTTCHQFITHKPKHYYTGTFDTLIKIIRTEGFRVLWSGLTLSLCISIPTVMIYFTSYIKVKQLLSYNEQNPNPILPVIAGACSRLVTVTIVSPFELIRTKMQSEKLSYQQLYRMINTSLVEVGPRILWKGLIPTLWRDIPFSMIYWFHYEIFRVYLIQSNININSYTIFASGALAGSIAATLTTPVDVVKTLRQIEFGQNITNPINYSSKIFSILFHIYRIEGTRGLFIGLIPRLLKVAPACAIMITSFEMFQSIFQRIDL